MVSRVAKNGSDQHGADIEREHKANALEESRYIGTNTHAEQDFARSQHELFRNHGNNCSRFHIRSLINSRYIRFVAVQVILRNQAMRNRAAHKGTGNQAEGCHSDGNGTGAFNTHVFKERTKSSTRTMAADKRYGTGAEAKERMQAHNFGKADTNDVLQGNKDSADNREDQNVAAAFFKKGKGCRKTDARKEHVHKEALLYRIKFDGTDTALMKGEVQKSKEDTANNRVRDAVRTQELNAGFQELTQIIQQNADCHCLIRIQS